MSALPCCILLPMLFAAAVVLASSPPPAVKPKASIYLVSVHGEPPLAAAAGVDHRNATAWYRAQKTRLTQLHDRLLRRASMADDGDGGGGAGGRPPYRRRPRKIYSFHHSVNGFAVQATAALASRLRAAPEVAAVEEDVGAHLMTTYTPKLLRLPDGVWPPPPPPHRSSNIGDADDDDEHDDDDGGVDGEGVVVGVVDSGIDPAHPSFAYAPRRRRAAAADDDDDDGRFFAGELTCSVGVGPMFPRGSCNGKIVTARYFAAGATAAGLLLDDPERDLSPFDAEGHGSHVASVAAGNRGVPVVVAGAMYGFASGMAPRAKLAVYKAVYPAGGTVADLIAAIDQAVEDKVDVLVLSVGPDERPAAGTKVTFLSMLDVALLHATRAGVFVAQAAGNRGPAEASVVSYSPWVTTVAAATTGRSYTSWLALGDGRRIPGLGLSAPTSWSRLVAAKDAAAAPDTASMERAEECQDAEALRWRGGDVLRGSIVICSFSRGFYNGTSTVTAILDVAVALGFAGFVLVADARQGGGDFLAQPLPFATVPGVMVTRVADAETLWSYYAAHTMYGGGGSATVFGATATITDGRVAAFTDAAAPVVTQYSSRGPDVVDGLPSSTTPADVLKPDILAPGDQIWAAWSALSVNEPILAGDHFAMVSGTSMAAPHVGGVAALIKQRHPSWGPATIASVLSTTALRHDCRKHPIMSEGVEIGSLQPATPFHYGAGFVNPAGAMDPGLVVVLDPDDYTGFLCSLPQLSADDVRAATGLACPASSSLVSPVDLNLPSITVSALRGSTSVRRRVRNVASDAETYLCSALPPAGVDATVRPGWFEVAPGGTQEVVIELRVTRASDAFSFGEIVLTGSLDHLVRLPLAVRPLAT